MQLIQEQIIRLSALSSLDNASIKILVCLFLSFPLNAIFKRMPDHYYNFKNYYIIGVSAFYIFEILELYSGFMTLFISSMFTYLITKYYKSKYMPWINFIFLMSHLLLNHIEAQFFNVYDPTKIDITGSQMVLVMKLSSFGWSYYDGLLYEKDKQRFDQTLNTYQKSRVILKHPKLISFLSYCFYYPSLLTGPAFDYADYEKFILTDLFEDVPENKKPGRRRKRKIPKSGRIALYKVFQGIGWAALMVILSSKISPEYFFTTEFQKKTLLYKIWYLYISAFFYRLRYYAVWLIAEGSCILSGIGYNGYDKQKDKFYWNRVQNIDPYAFETSQNVHTGFEAWNMNTNKWLKNYVYLRTVVKRDPITFKPQPGFLSTFATFATSAMWHGTKPGYYLSFITGAFYQTCGKLFRKNLRPLFISKNGSNVSHYKIFYDIISYITTQLAFAYLVQPFVILDFSKSLFVWRQVYFFIHFSILITIFVFSGPFAKPIIKTLKQYHMQDTTIETKKPQEMVKEEPIVAEPSEQKNEIEEYEIIPEFDNQEELRSTLNYNTPSYGLPDGDLRDLKKNFNEDFEKIKALKESISSGEAIIDEKEKIKIKKAFEEMRKDLNI